MKKNYISFLKSIAFLLVFIYPNLSQSQITISNDNASNYASWTNGSNSGTGFTNWDLWTENGGTAGHFLGDSAAQGFGDINTSNKAFGMYGNPSGSNPQANAQRFLNNTGSPQVGGRSYLLPGQSFKIDLAIAFRNGYKGVDFLDQNFAQLFNFGAANDLYSTTSGNLAWTYSLTSIFQLEVQQTDTNTYVVIITRGADVYNSGNRTGQFSGVKLYVGNTEAGNDLNNLFFNNMILQRCGVTTTWNGTAWSNGLPNANKTVAFTGNYTSSGNIEACSVSISSGAQVTIADGHTFTIENNITVDAGSNLIFENNASLLQVNSSAINTGSINFRRNSMPMRQYEYTYWGSPVSGQTLIGFSPNTSPTRYHSFNTSTNVWVNESPSNTMQPGVGYAIRAPNSYDPVNPSVFNGEFIGTPNNGNVVTNVVQFNGAQLNYNLLGNPYPSAINVQSLIDNSTLGTLYFWTHHTAMANNVFTPADYAIRTRNAGTAAYAGGPIPGDFIAAGQGFFASSSATGSLTYTNTMRVANNNSQFFRTASQPDNAQFYYYNISMTNTTGAFTQISLGYEEGATNGYDFLQDSYQQASTPAKFYSIINGYPGDFAIQGRLFPWTNTDQIQLGYTSTIAGDYEITLSNVAAFFTTQDIFIEDAVTTTFHNLKNSSYTFTTGVGTFNNRFKIHYVDPTLSNTEFEVNSNSVFVNTNENEIVVNSNQAKIKSIEIYDILGRVVFAQENINTNKFSTTKITSKNQALIVKTKLENSQVVSKKLIF